MFLDSYTGAHTEPDVHKLIVTGILHPETEWVYRTEASVEEKVAEYGGIVQFSSTHPFAGGEIHLVFAADDTTYKEGFGHYYGKVFTVSMVNDSPDVRALMLPEQRYPSDYPFYIPALYDGEKKFAVFQGMSNTFFIYNVLGNRRSREVRPFSSEDVIGVDGRSGNLYGMRISEDGSELRFSAVHAGRYVYDISDLENPVRKSFEKDAGVNF